MMEEGYERNSGSTSSRKLRVTMLSSEWRSTKGGLSTINRELAIQLAKHPNVEVSVYLPQCSEGDKRVAASHHVHLIEAEEMAGLEPDLWLSCLPEDHAVDCVIGHGAVLGRQVQIIKHHHHCKWIQVVHTAPEELGMYKSYTDAISRGEKKHQAVVKLCEKSDQVVAVGPKLAEAFSGYLRSCGKDQGVLNLTPGIFSEFADVKQATEERQTFSVLAFGRGDNEDFQLKGYDIAAKAIAELKDDPQPYKLLFVGARDGEEEKVKDMLLEQGVDRSQLSVRCFNESREQLAGLFCEADLAIMPSRTEGFGLAALEALSAGLPVLVSGNSGLGETLMKVSFGSNCVVESENPKDWACAIRVVRKKDREMRLDECKTLREKYAIKYNWQDHCNRLVDIMLNISRGNIASNEQNLSVTATGDCQLNEEPSHSNKGENLDIRIDCDASEQGGISSTQNVNREENVAPKIYPSTQEVMNLITAECFKTIDPSNREELNGFCQYLSNIRQLLIVDNKRGSLIITVRCNSLQILEGLWEDYCSGHLQEVAQRYLVTKDILKELGVDELQLTVTINEEEYGACRKRLLRHEENQKSASATNKDQDNEKESIDTTAEVQHHSNPLLKSVREIKQIVATRPPRRTNHRGERALDDTASSRGASSRSAPHRKQRDEGPEEIRGRGFRERRGRGRGSQPGRNQGRAAAGSDHQPGAIQRQLRDPVSLGFTQPGIRYEWNKLYVLGLHYRTSPDSLKNFMELISGYKVKRVDWFKPNGKAIVTFNIKKLTGYDFSNITSEAALRPQEGVNVLIERAPECKSIFVSGFSEDTTVKQVETYFEKKIGALDPARGVQINHQLWNEEKKHKRAIVYFKDKKSLWKATRNDHFLDGRALHVKTFYPYMGTIVPVDEPKWPSRPLSSEAESAKLPEFYKSVDRDLMGFVMKSNQEVKLKEELDQCEHARIRWTNEDGYVLIKYGGTKVDRELDEQAWKRRCCEIVDSFLDNCCVKEFPLEEEIVDEVADQLPQIERLLPKLTAQVKLEKESCQLRLMCQKSNMPDFEEKLTLRLKEIKRQVLEKTLEQKKRTDIASEKLQLLQNVKIEDLLKKEFTTEVQAKLDLGGKSLVIKTPKGLMESVMSHLNKRLDEIDHNSIPKPPEILGILKTIVGKRKMKTELPEGCTFNVDEKSKSIILLGRTLDETVRGREKAMEVLISDRNLFVKDKDNHLIGSEKWDDLCKKLEKRLRIRIKRELSCIAVFGFKRDVAEAVTKMRDFLNEKKATEGEFRLDSPVHRRFFNEFYKDELTKIKEELAIYAVKISLEVDGYRICFSGTEDGVKEVEERLYLMQEQIKKKTVNISTPGIRTFLAQDEGKRLIAALEQEQKCIIEITEQNGDQVEGDESGYDEPLSTSSDGEEELERHENKETIVTPAGKKIIWKTGNIEEEQADILVCSVGSNFKLSIGAVATAMSKAAGPALEQALREKENETVDLGEGDIIHTVPGNLPCRWVIHCVCCPWKGTAEQTQILRDLLRKCFDKASVLEACSIGLPLIGTGNLNFPYDIAVQIMIEAALDYSQANPDSPLEEFRFIVYGGDQPGITEFEEKFREFKKENYSKPRPSKRPADLRKRRPMTPTAEFSYKVADVGGLAVTLVKGDITQECSDAICNVVTGDLDMESGNLSKVIAGVCGEAVQRELRSKAPQRPGEVLMTSPGLLSTKNIIHLVVGSGNKQHLQTCVEKALDMADSASLDSVSIPAVGSGGLGLSPEDSAEVVFKAIVDFADKPSKSVYDVRVVVFDDSKIDAFVNQLENFQRENAPISYFEDNEEVKADAAYNIEALEASDDDLPTCRRQKVIVHGSAESFEAVIKALKDGLAKACKNQRVIKHEVISRLSKRCIRDLKRMARARHVKLDQPEADTIRLEGLPKDVMDINSEVSDAIQEQREREHREERAEQTSKTVRWYMVDVSGKLEPFEKMANNEIDSAYKSKKLSFRFTHENLKAEINFGTMEVTFLRSRTIKQVQRIDVYPLPNEWDPQPRDERGKEEALHLVSLAQDSQEFKTVEEKFLQSLRGKVSITNIERVQNPSLFNAYAVRKQTMDLKNGPHENQLELFHGTKYESLKPINVQGFNRSLCGKNAAAYGDGVYFAKYASYSETYSQPGPHGERCMYLAKVLVGKYTAGKQGMKRPPPIDPTKPEILYDSVVNRKDDPTIFVIFNDFHCYPEYIITFKRL